MGGTVRRCIEDTLLRILFLKARSGNTRGDLLTGTGGGDWRNLTRFKCRLRCLVILDSCEAGAPKWLD